MGAFVLGLSAALALWAFEFGRSLAGLDRHSKDELDKLKAEITQLRVEREKAQSIADTADSLLKTEKTTLDRLTQQLKLAEATNAELKSDLGFYERLIPASGDGISIRGLQVQVLEPGKIRYLMLVIQSGKSKSEFKGRYDIAITGVLDGKPWTQAALGGSKSLSVMQSARFEGVVEVPVNVVVKTVQARILDGVGVVKSTQQARF